MMSELPETSIFWFVAQCAIPGAIDAQISCRAVDGEFSVIEPILPRWDELS